MQQLAKNGQAINATKHLHGGCFFQAIIVRSIKPVALTLALLTCAPVIDARADDSSFLVHENQRNRDSLAAQGDHPTGLPSAQTRSLPAMQAPGTTMQTSSLNSSLNSFDAYYTQWQMQQAWITDVGLLLFNDEDQDGYYSGFSLSVDADTFTAEKEVYLTLLLQTQFATSEHLHTSAVFPLYAESSSDDYQIDIEIVRNYPSHQHDLTIELRDAWDGHLLERVGAAEFSNLRALPLESEEFDALKSSPNEAITGLVIDQQGIRVQEYAGSLNAIAPMALALIALLRRRIQPHVNN